MLRTKQWHTFAGLKNCKFLMLAYFLFSVQATATQPHKKQQCVASNGKIHEIGQEFTDMNCSSRCRCNDGGLLTCKPLCMALSKDSFCANKNVVHLPVRLPDAEGRRCSCPLVMCGAQEVEEQVYDANGKIFDNCDSVYRDRGAIFGLRGPNGELPRGRGNSWDNSNRN